MPGELRTPQWLVWRAYGEAWMAVIYTARLCKRMAAYVGPKRSALEYGYNKPPLSSCKLRMKP